MMEKFGIKIGDKFGRREVWTVAGFLGNSMVVLERPDGRQRHVYKSDRLLTVPYRPKRNRYKLGSGAKHDIDLGDQWGLSKLWTVCGFMSDTTVIVEDEDGFQRHVPKSDCLFKMPRLRRNECRPIAVGDQFRGWVVVSVEPPNLICVQKQDDPQKRQTLKRTSMLFRGIKRR